MASDRLSASAPLALGVLRIMTGLLFLAHGTQKFLSFPGGERAGSGLALDNPGAYAGIIELVTGLLVALGLFTRPAAFLASGTMACAYFMAHAPQNFFPVNNMGDAAILYCFIFLYLVLAGPGRLSLGVARRRGRPSWPFRIRPRSPCRRSGAGCADVDAFTPTCRFRDCAHEGEPGWGVDAAVADGSLDPGRLANWKKLRRELRAFEIRHDARAQKAEKARWKTISKTVRAHMKQKYGE